MRSPKFLQDGRGSGHRHKLPPRPFPTRMANIGRFELQDRPNPFCMKNGKSGWWLAMPVTSSGDIPVSRNTSCGRLASSQHRAWALSTLTTDARKMRSQRASHGCAIAPGSRSDFAREVSETKYGFDIITISFMPGCYGACLEVMVTGQVLLENRLWIG